MSWWSFCRELQALSKLRLLCRVVYFGLFPFIFHSALPGIDNFPYNPDCAMRYFEVFKIHHKNLIFHKSVSHNELVPR